MSSLRSKNNNTKTERGNMKKIYMPMMLAFSLYSANAVEPPMYTHPGLYCEEHVNVVRIAEVIPSKKILVLENSAETAELV